MKKVSLLSGFIFSMVSVLVSCMDESPERNAALPVKEIHYNFETGQKIGEKRLTYNRSGKLIREYFTAVTDQYDKEVRYEYDADGNLTKKMQREPKVSSEYYVNLYTYENGLKKSETTTLDGKVIGYRTDYFYSGSRIDSTISSVYIEGAYKYQRTALYEYDLMNRLVRAYDKHGSGNTIYRYQGNKLKETCNLVPGMPGDLEDCIENTYDSQGNLIRIASKSEWDNRVQEEFSYSLNLLREKKVYVYPIYEPGNSVDVTLIKYHY